MDELDLNPKLAKVIVHKLGSSGTPPEIGVEYFNVGLEPYIKVIENEYFEDILKYNLSSFKLIVGNYGGGKSHFLYLIRNLAWKHNYATSYVSLSATECPFDRLELVYKSIALNIISPLNPYNMLKSWEIGIEALLRNWYEQVKEEKNFISLIKNLESTSFVNAIKGALSLSPMI